MQRMKYTPKLFRRYLVRIFGDRMRRHFHSSCAPTVVMSLCLWVVRRLNGFLLGLPAAEDSGTAAVTDSFILRRDRRLLISISIIIEAKTFCHPFFTINGTIKVQKQLPVAAWPLEQQNQRQDGKDNRIYLGIGSVWFGQANDNDDINSFMQPSAARIAL